MASSAEAFRRTQKSSSVANPKFEINWGFGFVEVPPPINWQAMEVELIFTDGAPSAVMQSINFEWVGSNAASLTTYRAGGLTGATPGLFEAPGLKITACGASPLVIFNGGIDLANPATQWECDKVTAPIKKAGGIETFEDRARGFSFKFLAQLSPTTPGYINPATDYKKTPYVITDIPNYTQALVVGITIFLTIKELYEMTTKIAQLINQVGGDLITATASSGISAATLIADIANVVLYIIYLGLIIFALVKMIQSLIDNIIQRKKYKLCMREEDIWTRGCAYMGYTFISTIYTGTFKNATWMPKKIVMPDLTNPLNVFTRPEDEGIGFPGDPNVYGHPDGTFGQFISDMKQKYNGDVHIIGTTVYFREKHDFNNVSGFALPNIGPKGYTYNYPEPSGTNASELAANYFLSFALDESELNTIHKYRGTTCMVTITPNSIINQQNILLKGLEEVNLNCALAKRKEYLTPVESLLDTVLNLLADIYNFFAGAVNNIIGVINNAITFFGGSSTTIPTLPAAPTNIFGARIGWLLLSNDSFMIPKTFIGIQVGADWELDTFTETYMSASFLMQVFHGKNLATRGNQQLTYEKKTFPLCCADFVAIAGYNVLTTADGKKGKFRKLRWQFVKEERAKDVDYRVFTNFTNNLKETIIIDGH